MLTYTSENYFIVLLVHLWVPIIDPMIHGGIHDMHKIEFQSASTCKITIGPDGRN